MRAINFRISEKLYDRLYAADKEYRAVLEDAGYCPPAMSDTLRFLLMVALNRVESEEGVTPNDIIDMLTEMGDWHVARKPRF